MRTQLPKIKHFSVQTEINKAVLIDPDLRHVLTIVGYPEPRVTTPDFSTLAKIINSQQLSTQSAAAIWSRLENNCKGQVTHRKIINRGERGLLDCGLSRQKAAYLLGLARQIQSKNLNLAQMVDLSDEDVIKELIKIKGIGIWSGEIFAMFALGRKDFYPAGDLALQVAIQKYANLTEKPSEKEARAFALRWSPHRSSVALLMWKYYGSTTLD